MKKILFYSNIPSPYRVDFFNELGKHCDLTVLFEKAASDERDEKWKKYNFTNFRGIIMKGRSISTDLAFCPEIISYLKAEKYDEIVVTVLASPTAMLATRWLRRHHIPYIYEGDGGFLHADNKIVYNIKKSIIKNARLCFSTAEAFDDYCLNYKTARERLVRYPLSSIWDRDILDKRPDCPKKAALKEKYGISEEKVIISVGQMIPRKGFDLLIKACDDLPENWGIYLVGGKATPELEALGRELNIQNLHYIDFMDKESLFDYYQAADLFLLPTREDIWGLVVNEAMANGLAVITSDKCIAGLEMVENGKNGYIFQSENLAELKKILADLTDDPGKVSELGENAINTAHDYTIEKMVEVHINTMNL